ncbi:MAG TPA: hypothetical protein PKZ84_07805 [Anaerolineae bacterium]|nr:hypothetical protein [Anaerolineae bacterium]HQI84372.1 hypothetical protein [Anaerolineae bacterium]
MQALRITIAAAKAFYEEMLFFFMTGAILFVATLLIIPMPFALIGVWMVAHRAVRGLGINWSLYWQAIKEYGLRSLWLTLILILGYVLLASNVWFYLTPEVSPLPDSAAAWILPILIIVGLVWTGITFYAHAFLIELEEPKLVAILRNGFSISFISPLTTLILLVVALLLTALSIVIPVLLIALPGFIATLSITAVRTLITAIREKYGPREGESDLADQADDEQPATED